MALCNDMKMPLALSDSHGSVSHGRYGQMTAGSYCYIGPQGIVHGTVVRIRVTWSFTMTSLKRCFPLNMLCHTSLSCCSSLCWMLAGGTWAPVIWGGRCLSRLVWGGWAGLRPRQRSSLGASGSSQRWGHGGVARCVLGEGSLTCRSPLSFLLLHPVLSFVSISHVTLRISSTSIIPGYVFMAASATAGTWQVPIVDVCDWKLWIT